MAIVEIDKHSGFCSGVVQAIKKAEDFLDGEHVLYTLGDIVHNNMEVKRLKNKGMKTISKEELAKLKNADVLFRAHGEPPSTYKLVRNRNIRLIDATCPVVLNLQARIKDVYNRNKDTDLQIVIFGKRGHAEVVGLLGQTDNTAIVIENISELGKLDYSRPIILFSQTTKSLDEFNEIIEIIKKSVNPGVDFEYKDTICRQVANRLPNLRKFAGLYDCILFVSGTKSSNGKELYEACRQVNEKTFFITSTEDVKKEMVDGMDKIGICGATSTPLWLMQDVKKTVKEYIN